MDKKVKTLSDQMEECSLRKEKIEQLRKELIENPAWGIIEDDGEFYAVDMYNNHWLINVELRERLPNSYFHSPEFDDDIIGYDAYSGAIIYNLWGVGKTEMEVSEGISSDFHDTGYGIGKLLSSFKKNGYGTKVSPIYVLLKDFIDYHFDLQGSIYNWGYDVSLVNSIGMKEHHRLDLLAEIENKQKCIEKYGANWSEDVRINNQKALEDLNKEYAALNNPSCG